MKGNKGPHLVSALSRAIERYIKQRYERRDSIKKRFPNLTYHYRR